MRPKGAGGRGGEGVDILGGSVGSRWEVGCLRYGGVDRRGGAELLHGGWEGCQPARETSGGFPFVRDLSGRAVTLVDALLLHNFVLLCSRWPHMGVFSWGVLRKYHHYLLSFIPVLWSSTGSDKEDVLKGCPLIVVDRGTPAPD